MFYEDAPNRSHSGNRQSRSSKYTQGHHRFRSSAVFFTLRVQERVHTRTQRHSTVTCHGDQASCRSRPAVSLWIAAGECASGEQRNKRCDPVL
jgi:hypothetical protein